MDAQDRTTVVRHHWRAKSGRKLLARAVALVAILPAVAYHAVAQTPGPGAIVRFGDPNLCTLSPLPSGLHYRSVALGQDSGLAVRSDGAVLTIGNLGYAGSPPTPPAGERYRTTAIGCGLGAAIRTGGHAVTWSGASGGHYAPPAGGRWLKVAVGSTWFCNDYALALASDSTFRLAGSVPTGVDSIPGLPPGTAYVDVSAGYRHALALRSDGVAIGWGSCATGACVAPPLPPGTTYLSVAAGGGEETGTGIDFSAAVRSDGAIVVWGSLNVTLLPPAGRRFTQAAAGSTHVIGLLDDGTLFGWGGNSHGQATVPAPPPGLRFVQIAAGNRHSAARLVSDCNGNGILDDLEIRQGLAQDCDGNTFPDGCDLAEGWDTDCNLNGVPDSCDLASGVATDCNGNGVSDFCDVAGGQSPDCNANGVPDSCDIAGGASTDCNLNGVPDSCDLASGAALDCNGNGVPDSCDIAVGTSSDCNANAIPDSCDLASGSSQDTDSDGLPDECSSLGTIVCAGDGSGSPCPCGNLGALARGCANSANISGGMLHADGVASVALDSAILRGTGMPPVASVLYFQGTSLQNGGAGVTFGDGLRCAGGFVIRLDIETNQGGASSFPNAGDPAISVKGQIPTQGGVTRFYQAWYRDAAAFCAPSGFNLTNALRIEWGP